MRNDLERANGGQRRNFIFRMQGIKRDEPGPDAVIHIMRGGQTDCQKEGIPGRDWESNHFWVDAKDKARANCKACMEANL